MGLHSLLITYWWKAEYNMKILPWPGYEVIIEILSCRWSSWVLPLHNRYQLLGDLINLITGKQIGHLWVRWCVKQGWLPWVLFDDWLIKMRSDIQVNSYTARTLHACYSQSEFRVLKIRKNNARALFLYNCTLNTLLGYAEYNSQVHRIDSFTSQVILFCW